MFNLKKRMYLVYNIIQTPFELLDFDRVTEI